MKSDSSSLTDYQATGSHEKSFLSSNSLFVEAEKTERGYVQTNQDGTKHQFFEFDESNIFRIKSLNTFKNVDLETGKFKNHISGLTVEKIGCIGHNRQSSVLRVTISSDENPGFVKFRHGFSPGGIHLSGDVKIFLAAPVVNAITAEIESNTSALMISIMLNEKAFFSNADEQGGYSAPILDCFLPFLKDQKISLIERKIIIDEVAHISEEISIEWCFTLSQLTIFPESYDDGWAPGKRNLVKDDQQNHPLKEDFSKLLNLSDSFIRSTEMFLISVQRLAKSSKRYFLLLCLLLVVLKLLK